MRYNTYLVWDRFLKKKYLILIRQVTLPDFKMAANMVAELQKNALRRKPIVTSKIKSAIPTF
jgi:hypothetical protein